MFIRIAVFWCLDQAQVDLSFKKATFHACFYAFWLRFSTLFVCTKYNLFVIFVDYSAVSYCFSICKICFAYVACGSLVLLGVTIPQLV
jgi:hypothetical protein